MACAECTVHVHEPLECHDSINQVVHKRNYKQRAAADIEAVPGHLYDHDSSVDSTGFPGAQRKTKVRVEPSRRCRQQS